MTIQEKLRKLQALKTARRSSFDTRPSVSVEKKEIAQTTAPTKKVMNFLKSK